MARMRERIAAVFGQDPHHCCADGSGDLGRILRIGIPALGGDHEEIRQVNAGLGARVRSGDLGIERGLDHLAQMAAQAGEIENTSRPPAARALTHAFIASAQPGISRKTMLATTAPNGPPSSGSRPKSAWT